MKKDVIDRRLTSFAAAVGAAVLLAAGAAPARADMVNIESARDNTLFQNATGAISDGSGPSMFIGANTALNVRRAVIYFNVALALPESARVDSVRLTLHLSRTSSSVATLITVHRLLADWGEGTSSDSLGAGAASTTGDATWIHRFYPTMMWQTAGGDFLAADHAQASVNLVGFYNWSSSDMRDDVQSWVETPATNFGWLLKGAESTAASARRFDTREAANEALRPHLTIYYTPKGVPVEATTWGAIKAGVR